MTKICAGKGGSYVLYSGNTVRAPTVFPPCFRNRPTMPPPCVHHVSTMSRESDRVFTVFPESHTVFPEIRSGGPDRVSTMFPPCLHHVSGPPPASHPGKKFRKPSGIFSFSENCSLNFSAHFAYLGNVCSVGLVPTIS